MSTPHHRGRRTMLAHATRAFSEHGIVNPPVYHASTILAGTLEDYESGSGGYPYGRYGTPTTRALESMIAKVEGGHRTFLTPSGLAAISTLLLAMTERGAHVLLSDSVYGPTRRAADRLLGRYGVEAEYFDPRIRPDELEARIRPETALVFLESPGSLTMEVQDVPALARAAHGRGVPVAIDNTWSAGWYFDAFAAGCDISIQAATKYYAGHSDVLMGSITVTEEMEERIRETHKDLGQCVGPDDAYLVLRGMRTLDVRMARHMENALAVAAWLRDRPEVEAVLYPALPGAPDHDLWKRDFSGACGLFSFVLQPVSEEALHAFVNSLELFGIGASWGGYESLVLRFDPRAPGARTAMEWPHEGPSLRLHIGLEDSDDLIADLSAAFERMKEVREP